MTSRLVNEKSDSCFSLLFSSRITARGFVFIGLNSFLCTTQCNRKCRALCVRVFNACNELAARNKAIRFHHNRRENDLTGWWRRTFSLIPTFCYIFLCFLRCVRFSSTICSGTFFLSLSFFFNLCVSSFHPFSPRRRPIGLFALGLITSSLSLPCIWRRTPSHATVSAMGQVFSLLQQNLRPLFGKMSPPPHQK